LSASKGRLSGSSGVGAGTKEAIIHTKNSNDDDLLVPQQKHEPLKITTLGGLLVDMGKCKFSAFGAATVHGYREIPLLLSFLDVRLA
jgi:hypothetical protein